jgi:hypothetical protein
MFISYHLGKKWWFSLYKNCLTSAQCNAWMLHRMVNDSPMTHIEFLRSITSSLLLSGNVPTEVIPVEDVAIPPPLKRGHREEVPNEVRFNGLMHFPQHTENRLRCAMCQKLCNIKMHTMFFCNWTSSTSSY